MGCPGQDSALLSTDNDYTVLNKRTVQVRHHVHLQDLRKMFSVHAKIATLSLQRSVSLQLPTTVGMGSDLSCVVLAASQ